MPSRESTDVWDASAGLRRIEERLSTVNGAPRVSELQSFSELDRPEPFLERFFARYPAARSQTLASEDIAYFLAISQRPGQKPVPFIPVLNADFGICEYNSSA